MTKKIISIVLTMSLLWGALPFPAAEVWAAGPLVRSRAARKAKAFRMATVQPGRSAGMKPQLPKDFKVPRVDGRTEPSIAGRVLSTEEITKALAGSPVEALSVAGKLSLESDSHASPQKGLNDRLEEMYQNASPQDAGEGIVAAGSVEQNAGDEKAHPADSDSKASGRQAEGAAEDKPPTAQPPQTPPPPKPPVAENSGPSEEPAKNARIIFIPDVFNGQPAAPEIAQAIDRSLELGYGVVFYTAEGPDYINSVLLNHLKYRQNNRMLIVAYNGAMIYAQGKGQSESSAPQTAESDKTKSIIPDQDGFSDNHKQMLQGLAESVTGSLVESGKLAQGDVQWSFDGEYIFRVQFKPGLKKTQKTAWVGQFNRSIDRAGKRDPLRMLRFYRLTPDDPASDEKLSYSVNKYSLQRNVTRLLGAVDKQFVERFAGKEDVKNQPKNMMVIQYPKRFPQLVAEMIGKLPDYKENGEGPYQEIVGDGQSLLEALRGFLGDQWLKPIKINFSKLRSYVDYWLPMQEAGRSRFIIQGNSEVREGKHYLYLGIITRAVIIDILRNLRVGKIRFLNVHAGIRLLEEIWNNPLQPGRQVNLSPVFVYLRKNPQWRKTSQEMLERAKAVVYNLYQQHWFPKTPEELAQNAIRGFTNIAGDSKFKLVGNIADPRIKRKYQVNIEPDAVLSFKENGQTDKVLALLFRYGNAPFDWRGRILAKLLSLTLRQKQNYSLRPSVKTGAEFVYATQTYGFNELYTQKDSDASVSKLTSLIEAMESDEDFNDFWENREEPGDPKLQQYLAKLQKQKEMAKQIREMKKNLETVKRREKVESLKKAKVIGMEKKKRLAELKKRREKLVKEAWEKGLKFVVEKARNLLSAAESKIRKLYDSELSGLKKEAAQKKKTAKENKRDLEAKEQELKKFKKNSAS
ncbi:MAG: hypothetical protein HY611_09350 [Elusimicrobia bacterium]|nr:hypothetical protein [Elusimicrobiota bacterium]